MAVKLRLRRLTTAKRPRYAVVATKRLAPNRVRVIERLGHYEPVQNQGKVTLKAERIRYWLRQGAQPSNKVRSILSTQGIAVGPGLTEDEVALDLELSRILSEVRESARVIATASQKIDHLLPITNEIAETYAHASND
ncbi:MAG: 30S ribosomal protein S16 [Bacteroidota bacterium]